MLVYRDHWKSDTRPAWLKLKGTNRFRGERGMAYLRSLGVKLDWFEYLNHMVDLPLDGERVQDAVEQTKKRGRPRNEELGTEGPPKKKSVPRAWNNLPYP